MPNRRTQGDTTAATRVLVIEDEETSRRAIAQGLLEAGFNVVEAADGVAGLGLAVSGGIDVVLLDLRLPSLDGEHLLEKLRRSSAVPVLVVSAKRDEDDLIEALNLGADDYLVKPFTIRELLARMRAVLRRVEGEVTTTLRIGDVTIDFASRTVALADARVPLTAFEFDVLACLARRRGRLVSREAIDAAIHPRQAMLGLEGGTDGHEAVSNVVDVIVLRLRKKLGHGLIQTRRGQGFIIDG